MTDVAVILVTYNGSFWIDKCLKSLQESVCPLKIFVIDNASTDNTLDIVCQFSEVEIIAQQENLGFGAANNLGIKTALNQGFNYFFLLNQDTWVFRNSIGFLVDLIKKNNNFGVLSPLHYSGNERDLDENFQKYYYPYRQDDEITEVPFVNAAAWLVSKQCIEKVGLFEPTFHHYGEDKNFCDRLLFHKVKIGIVEGSKIVHDRVIKRNFRKDKIQSNYRITATFLDINLPFYQTFFLGLKPIIGMPKYFYNIYSKTELLHLFLSLNICYLKTILGIRKIIQIRKTSKLGKNGY